MYRPALDTEMGGSLSVDFSDLSAQQWPLISYLYADDQYKNQYDAYVHSVITQVFTESRMHALYDEYATLVEPYASSELEGHTFLSNPADFQSEVNQLKSHVTQRVAAAEAYLSRQ